VTAFHPPPHPSPCRYITSNFTSHIAWSPLWAVYTTLPYQEAGLMRAREPWSGHYDGAGKEGGGECGMWRGAGRGCGMVQGGEAGGRRGGGGGMEAAGVVGVRAEGVAAGVDATSVPASVTAADVDAQRVSSECSSGSS
jgi:hypothetical protein